MSELSSFLEMTMKPLNDLVERSFSKFPLVFQRTIAVFIILVFVIAIFTIIALVFGKDNYIMPLIISFGLAMVALLIAYGVAKFLGGGNGDLPPETKFQFVNREKELNEITEIGERSSPLYYLVDGPAGYGKSGLLEALKGKFEREGKECALVKVQYGNDIDAVIKGIIDELELDRTRVYRNGINRFDSLAKEIKRRIDNKALVLLFDFDKVLAKNELDRLITDLLPPIRNELYLYLGSRLNSNQYRVVIAGQGIWPYVSSSHRRMQFKKVSLSPFTFAAVRESTQNYFPSYHPDIVDQLAAHTLYFSGGHPGSMVKILALFKERGTNPSSFFENNSQEIWKEIVSSAVNDVHVAIPDPLQVYFYELSLFRRYDEEILLRVLKQRFPKCQESAYTLYQKMTTTGLLKWEDGARDEMVGRLLSIGLRNNKWGHYQQLSEFAVTIYNDPLFDQEKPNSANQHTLSIEGLFQKIRHKYECFPDHRHNLRARFFEEDGILNKYLACLPKDSMNIRESLLSDLENYERSWEFRFCVNYFLCNGCYEDACYDELLARVKQYFQIDDQKDTE